MKKLITPILIVLILGINYDCFAQAVSGQRAVQGTGNMNYGYCLSNIDISPEQQAKIEKLMVAQQDKMAVLRTKVRTAPTWEDKVAYWDQMDALVVKHREEIWAVVPEARAQANIGRLNRTNYGRAGFGRGRGGAGKGLGRGAGRGLGRGAGRGYIR